MRVPATMWVGTMVRTPFDSIAGLNEPDAVWPFTTGSVSVISRVTRAGNSIESAVPSKVFMKTFIPSCRNAFWSPITSSGTAIWS